jgi:hypothetical protein
MWFFIVAVNQIDLFFGSIINLTMLGKNVMNTIGTFCQYCAIAGISGIISLSVITGAVIIWTLFFI